MLAIGLAVGTRMDHMVRGRTNPLFVQLWLGVFLLIFALLLLGLLDWFATRRYAYKHRRAMLREHDETLRDVLPRVPIRIMVEEFGGPGRRAPPDPPPLISDPSHDQSRVKTAWTIR